MRAPRLLGVLLVALVTVAGCSSGHDFSSDSNFTFVSPGGKTEFSYAAADRQALNELSGPDLSGTKTLALSDYRGKVVVINFWGSWCAPCRLEAADLQAASTQLQSKGVQFLGIDVQDEKGAGAAFAQDKQVTYPSIYDPGMRTLLSLRGYPTSAIPSTIVVDKSGRVAHIWIGGVTKQQLVGVITPIAAET